MATLLQNTSKVSKAYIHPIGEGIIELIDELGFTFYISKVKNDLKEIISSTIRTEGILNSRGDFYLISPLFELRIVNTPLIELLNKNTIVYKENELTNEEITISVWSELFKYLFLSIDSTQDISTIQQQLKLKFPTYLCQQFFEKKFLSEQFIANLTRKSRGAIVGQKYKKLNQTPKTSAEIFIPSMPVSSSNVEENQFE